MRLHIRSVVGVAFLLVLFIFLAYQAQTLRDESVLRLKQRHQKDHHDRIKHEDEIMSVDQVDQVSVHVLPIQKPRVNSWSAQLEESNKLQDRDTYKEEANSIQEIKLQQDTDHLRKAQSEQDSKFQQDTYKLEKENLKQEAKFKNQTNHLNEAHSKQESKLQQEINHREKQNSKGHLNASGLTKEAILQHSDIKVSDLTTNAWTEKFNKIEPFQSAEEVEFPTKDGVAPRIPHIIHQIGPHLKVIANYSRYIKTFIEHNPKWEYRFWSHESGRRLIADRHPYLLPTFDNFTADDVKKTDIIKYTVMYEFGGFYSDIDVKNFRPLDKVTTKYACIIPIEPIEHAAFKYHSPVLLNVGILMCRPKHPFFKLIIKQLHVKKIEPDEHPVPATGLFFLSNMFLLYNNMTVFDLDKPKIDNSTNTPYFYKGTRPEDDDDGIYIPNSQYFMDNVDHLILVKEEDTPFLCRRFKYVREFDNLLLLSQMSIRACAEYERRKHVRRNKKYTFTEHYWHHIYAMDINWLKSLKMLHIKDIVPNCKLY